MNNIPTPDTVGDSAEIHSENFEQAPAAACFSTGDIADALNLGLCVVDANGRILLWNDWLVRHSNIKQADALNRPLEQVFPEPVSPAFLSAVKNTLSYRLPVVLSTALHRTPLPLYNAVEANQQRPRMHQSITIAPLRSQSGESCCLIQVTDSSTSIKREKMLRSHSEKLKKETITDSLTGISNRRFFDAHYEIAVAEARRQQHPISVFMIDIDFFKTYNDHYGHIAGDNIIRRVADALKAQLSRATDIIARYGGEEFVLVMPHLSDPIAAQFAEKLRNAVFDLAIPHEKYPAFNRVTVSIGVCTGMPEYADDMLNKADTALYQAKQKGRNRCVMLPLRDSGP